ncbi:hypothetical protein C5C17_03580 [Pseudoclavibacter sp. RFBA6]|nr:hypothetical protein C5C17_03580 [Pseudoclavibacter sp. RFBA6]
MTPDLKPHWSTHAPKRDSDSTPFAARAARVWVKTSRVFRSRRAQWIAAASAAAVLAVVAVLVLSNLTRVPSLVGTTFAEATTQLDTSRLEVGDIDWVKTLDKDRQVVKTQLSSPAAMLWAGTSVDLEMEAAPVSIPDFAASDVANALILADEVGVSISIPFTPTESQSWKVLSQDPSAGTNGRAGDAVELTLEVPNVAVPDLAGLTVSEATSALTDAGLRGEASPTGYETDWTVSAQATAAGASVQHGTSVAFTVQAPLVTVPDLSGKNSTTADSELKALGLTSASASPTARGSWTITGQEPAAGTQVAEGSTVTYTLTGPTITFEITGNGSTAMVTWAPPGSFSISQDTGASVPWSMTFPDNGYDRYERGNFNAQMLDGDSITCTMYRNGEVVLTNTSSGPYAVVSCG